MMRCTNERKNKDHTATRKDGQRAKGNLETFIRPETNLQTSDLCKMLRLHELLFRRKN